MMLVQLLSLWVIILSMEVIAQNPLPSIFSIRKDSSILNCPNPLNKTDSFGKRQLGGQYTLNNQATSITLGLWVNYYIPIEPNSQTTNYGLFYFSSDTTDTTSQEGQLRLLMVSVNENQSGSTTTTTIQLTSFTNTLTLQIPTSLQNQWVYVASTLNLSQNRLELGVIYYDSNMNQIISNTSKSLTNPISLSSYPNIGLYPLWVPVSELLCGQVYNFYFFTSSSFYQNNGQLTSLSQTSESYMIGHFALQSNYQVLPQQESNLAATQSQLLMVNGYSQVAETQSDVQYQQMTNLSNSYYPILQGTTFYTLKQLNIEKALTLIFDYYTQTSITDAIFVSQSLSQSGLRMFAISQLSNSTGLFLNVTIQGQDVIFQTQLTPSSLINIGLSISCSPPFTQTILNLRMNFTIFEQQILAGVCFNFDETNKKVFLGYYEVLNLLPSQQYKIVSNLIIVKGHTISGINSQSEVLVNYRQIENCEFILPSLNNQNNQCIRCSQSTILYKNQCVSSQDCYILDEITLQPQLSQVIGNNCFINCSNSTIIQHNSLCNYDLISESQIISGSLNLTSSNPSQIVSGLTYTNNPQVFLGFNGMMHDGSTQGYNFSVQVNNIQPTQFEVDLVENTSKLYQSFMVSYLVAPNNSKKVEIGQAALNSSNLLQMTQNNTVFIYQIPFISSKLYIPNVVVSVQSYNGLTNLLQLNYTVINISYTGFQLQVQTYSNSSITSIQYIAFKGYLNEQAFQFTNQDVNQWGTQPGNSTFRYLNTANYTFVQRVDPQILPISVISGVVKSNDTYQGIDFYNVNNTLNYGKMVVDYVQANQSALDYFKASSFFVYKSCYVSACKYTAFDNTNIIGFDNSLVQNPNHPLQTGSGTRQFISRIVFDKYFSSIPQVFVYYEQIDVPETSSSNGISFQFNAQNINYDGFDLVYQVFNSFLLKSMRLKYFATTNSNIQINSVTVTPNLLSLQPSSQSSYQMTSNFQNQFSSPPLVMVSVYAYSGDAITKLSYNITIALITTSAVTFNIQVQSGTLSAFSFQYIAIQQSSAMEIQALTPAFFDNTPVSISFDQQAASGSRRRYLQSSDPTNTTTSPIVYPSIVIMNDWLTKYWDRWNISSFISTPGITYYSSNPNILSPIQSITTGSQSACDVDFQIKSSVIQNQGAYSYATNLNVEREFIEAVSISNFGILKSCPSWCTQCNDSGICLQCKNSNLLLPNCTSCPQGYQNNQSYGCIQCINGCCKSNLSNTLCTSCSHPSLYQSLNCGCYTNEQFLYIAWQNQIQVNVTLVNGGDQDSFTLLGCSSCTQVKTNRTIILTQTGQSNNYFAVYSNLGNYFGTIEYQVTIINPPQFICYGAIKQEKLFMIGLSSAEISASSLNVNHLQNSMSYCSDRSTYSADGTVNVNIPVTLNWQKTYSMMYQNNTFILTDISQSLAIYSTQFYLSYNMTTNSGYPNFNLKCENYTLAKFGTYTGLKEGLNTEVVKSTTVSAQQIYSSPIFSQTNNAQSSLVNVVIQGWFYINTMSTGVNYSLFEVDSSDSLEQIGVSCNTNSIFLSYKNPPDTVYQYSNYPAITGLSNLSEQWFYIALEWVNGVYDATLTLKLIQQKGFFSSALNVYKLNTAQFIFSGQNLQFTVNNGQLFSGSQWTGQSMDFGFYKLLSTSLQSQNATASLVGLNLNDTSVLFSQTSQQVLFYYEFTRQNFSVTNFIKDSTTNNNNFMDSSYLNVVNILGLNLTSFAFYAIPAPFYQGIINEDYGFNVAFKIQIITANPIEGVLFKIGQIKVRLVVQDGTFNQLSSSNLNYFYYLQFCIEEIECINSSKVFIIVNQALGMTIQFKKIYKGNQRLLAVSIYSENSFEENLIFSSQSASSGFTVQNTASSNIIRIGSVNNDFISTSNYILIGRLILQNGSYVKPSYLLLQNGSDDEVINNFSLNIGQTIPASSYQFYIMLNRLQSQRCLLQLGKDLQNQICVKCNQNYQNVFGICISNGECANYSLVQPYQNPRNKTAFYFDYSAKTCLQCNDNCGSCMYSPGNCLTCSSGFINPPSCTQCPYVLGQPTYFNPDTQQCISSCPSTYCTDSANLICTKCDSKVRNIFYDFDSQSNSYRGSNWVITNLISSANALPYINCYINQFYLTFFGGSGTLDGSSSLSIQPSNIPLHYQIQFSFILLISQANFTVNSSSIQQYLQLQIDSQTISSYTLTPIIQNQMICSSSLPSSSVYSVTVTQPHMNTAANFTIGFNFNSNSALSPTLQWGLRYFSINIYQCHYSCFTCSGPNVDQCLSCTQDLIFVYGKCLCPQATQYLSKSYSCQSNPCYSCQTCNSPCSNCDNDNICLQCVSGYYLYLGVCYSDCSLIPSNLLSWPSLANSNGLCVPTNLNQQINFFNTNQYPSAFNYTKNWNQNPIQTPGQYLQQCGTDNFVGPFTNTIFQTQINMAQPFYSISMSFQLLLLNQWLSTSLLNITINNSPMTILTVNNQTSLTAYSQCTAYPASNLQTVGTKPFLINKNSFSLTFTSTNFNSISWGIRNISLTASLCPIYCAQCNSQNLCTSCVPGGVVNPQTNVCTCAAGYVLSLKPQCTIQPCGLCLQCHQSCQTCTGLGAFNCVACQKGFKRLGQRCVSQCPDNYYLDINTLTCYQCDSSCYSCLGPFANNCVSCYAPQVLQDSYCVDSCTLPNQQLDTFTQSCLLQPSPNVQQYLSNSTIFQSDITTLYSSLNPSQSSLSYTCQGQQFAGPFINQVILNFPNIQTHSQIILTMNVFTLSSTTLTFKSSTAFLSNTFSFSVSLTSSQSCSSSTLNIKNIIAYINSFQNGIANSLQITITSSSSQFSINTVQFETLVCHRSCLTCSGTNSTNCLSCVQGATIQPDGSCACTQSGYYLMYIQGSLGVPIHSQCSQCQYPCTSCFQVNNYSCNSCQEGFYLKEYSCVTSCPPLKYQQVASLGICKLCPFPCDECTPNGQQCLSCVDGYVLTLTSQCASSCWESQYVDANNSCQTCDLSCESCTGPNPSDCTSCNTSYFYNTQSQLCQACNILCYQCTDSTNTSCSECQPGVVLYNNTICTADCSEIPGTYPSEDNCLPCDPQCLRCQGPSFSDCLQCQDGFALVNSICVPCDTSCLTCYGKTSSQCYSCSSGFTLQGNSCVLQCVSGYYSQNGICQICNQACSLCYGGSNDQCYACSNAYFFTNNSCIPCHPNCQMCYGSLVTQCFSCSANSFLLNTRCYGTADGGCPSGYYGDTSTGKCTQCNYTCASCQGSSDNMCLSCPTGSYLSQISYNISGNLLPSTCSYCPNVCSTCTSSTQCTQCVSSYYLYQGECLLTCPSGYYADHNSGNCLLCIKNCATCSGYNTLGNFICNSCQINYYLSSDQSCQPCGSNCSICTSSTSCINCVSGYYNFQGTCSTTCPIAYYPSSSSNVCVQCIKPCSVCTSPTMCEACSVGYYLQNTLNSQNKIISASCISCNPVCNGCTAGTANDCISCQTPLSLQGNVCQQSCNAGYYSNAGVCYQCESNCLSCSSATMCNVCVTGYVSVSGVCQLCDYRCSSCFGVDDNSCSSCITPYYLYQSTCQLTCPDQFFYTTITINSNLQSNICSQCSGSCYNCNGPNQNQCTSCISGYYLTAQNTCQQCSSSCTTCSTTSTNCTSCPLGQFLYNSTCITSCPSGYYGYDQNNTCQPCNSPCNTCTGPGVNQCISCLQSYFYNQGSCLPCNQNCLSCYGINSTECYTCQLGTQQVGSSCISCGDGSYYDAITNTCAQCNTVCLTCYGGSSSNCSSCVTGKYLQNSTCNICPSNCTSCTSSSICTSCVSGYYLLLLNSNNQTCTKECPTGMIPSQNQECGCTSNCSACPIDSVTLNVTCSKCISADYVINYYDSNSSYQCISKSSCDGFIDVASQQCVQSCSTTTPFINMITKQCLKTSCPSGSVTYYTNKQGQCLAQCPQGYFANSQSVCSPCNHYCSSCTGPTAEQCTSCVSGAYYHPAISTCSDSCLIGYIQDSTTGYCVVCYSLCKACLQNLVFLNGLCLTECPVGYTQTAAMTCIESSNELVKILNSYNSPVGITKDIVLQASVFAMGPITSIEWVLEKCSDTQFVTSFELLNVSALTLTVPFLALKPSKEILNDGITFTTAGLISSGSFIVNPTSGVAGSDLFQLSLSNYKYPLPLTFDISYYSLSVQYSNTVANDGSIVQSSNPSFVKQGLVQIYSAVSFIQGQTSTLTYVFPINFNGDQNIAIELKIYSQEGGVEQYDYVMLSVKKTVKSNQSIFLFNSNNVFDPLSLLNYSLNLLISYQMDSAKLKALQQNSSINMQIALSLKKTYSPNAQCDPAIDCFGNGKCVNTLNVFSCQCSSGYMGSNCQWSESDYTFLNANVPLYISYVLSSSVSTYSNIIVAQAIGNIFYYNDFNNQAISLATQFINLLTPIVNNSLDYVQIQLYQTICKSLITSLQTNYGTAAEDQITQLQTLNQNVTTILYQNMNMGESLSQQSSECDSTAIPLTVQMVNTTNTTSSSTPAGRRQLRRLQKINNLRKLQSSSTANTAIPVVFRSLSVQIPPQVINSSQKMIISASNFQIDPRANPLAITTTVSLSLGGNSGQHSVSDAPQPFVMTIPKKVPSPPGINTSAISCTYYDEATNSYQSDGCTFVKETITAIICSCTHLTDFSAALQPALMENSISLTDMQAAQQSGNALLAAMSPTIITIVSLPAPKIGQRNVNLVNALNIQMSGGINVVLAKQAFIVSADQGNYTVYNMWDSLNQDTVTGLIQNKNNTSSQIIVSESSNVTYGQYLIIVLTVIAILCKIAFRAIFKCTFVDEDDAPPETILNEIHKQNVRQNEDGDDIEDSENSKKKKRKMNENEYEHDIMLIADKIKINQNNISPKETTKISLQDEIIEAMSSYKPQSHAGAHRKDKKQIDEVAKKTIVLKKKYEQEKRLQQLLEQVKEGGNEEMNSSISKVTMRNVTQQGTEQIEESESQYVKSPVGKIESPLPKSSFNTVKKSQFVKQVISHDVESQFNLNSPRGKSNSPKIQSNLKSPQKLSTSQSPKMKLNSNSPKAKQESAKGDHQTPSPKTKKNKSPKQVKVVFQKINTLNIEDEKVQTPSYSPQMSSPQKLKKSKKEKKKQKISHSALRTNENLQQDEHERVLTTEGDDHMALVLPTIRKNVSEKVITPVSSFKKSKFGMVADKFQNFSEKVIEVTKKSGQFAKQKIDQIRSKLSQSDSPKTARSQQSCQLTSLRMSDNFANLRQSQDFHQLSFAESQRLKIQNEIIQNELAILRMRENVEKSKQKISSKNINPIYSIFRAKETLFQTKMSRMLYFYITFYGYLAYDFLVFNWCGNEFPEIPFIDYLFFYNPYRIAIIITLSNVTSHILLGFINHLFSTFIKNLNYDQVTIKMLNKLRYQHLFYFSFMFISMYSIYSSIIYNFAQTKYYSMSQIQEILIEMLAAQFIDTFVVDTILVLFHSLFVNFLPDDMALKQNYETFQSQRGFFYTSNTEHSKVLDLIL